MSREGNNFSYKPKKGTVCSGELTRRMNRSQRAARVNYTEVEITSGSESEGTIEGLELNTREIKSEREGSVPSLDIEGEDKQWTPDTLARTTSRLSQQFGRVVRDNREFKMAREVERGGLQQVMQMMVEMRAADEKAGKRDGKGKIE